MASTGVGTTSGGSRRLVITVGLVGVGQLLLPLVARAAVNVAGPWSGTAALMVRSLALLVPAGLLWTGVRRRAALWSIVILGGLAVVGLPSTVERLLDGPPMPTALVAVMVAALVLEVATVTAAVAASRDLQPEASDGPGAAGWVAVSGAAALGVSQFFFNTTVALPDGTPQGVRDALSSPFMDLWTVPWPLVISIIGTALVAVAAAVLVLRRWAPALGLPLALLPATVAGAFNDLFVVPIAPDGSAPELVTTLAVGGWLNLAGLLLLVAAAALDSREPGGTRGRRTP